MDAASFDKLSPGGRKLWSQLSMDDRTTLLGSKPETSRSVNHTEMAIQEEGSVPGDDGSDNDTKPDALDVNKTETRSSAKSKAHPADIRRSLSSSASKKIGNQARRANMVHWGVDSESDDDIPPNDDPFVDEDVDASSQEGPWPAFSGDVEDHWGDSSSDEDFA